MRERRGWFMFYWENGLYRRVDFDDGTEPFHRRTNGAQPSKTIFTNGYLTWKPSENHWSQWLPSTIPFNGDCNFENHWKFAMVAKECAKSPTNTTTNFKLKKILSFRVYLHLKCISSSWSRVSLKISREHLFFRFLSRSKLSLTIAPEFGKTIGKPSISMVDLYKNIQWWWSRAGKTIEKPSMAMVPWKKKHYHPIV